MPLLSHKLPDTLVITVNRCLWAEKTSCEKQHLHIVLHLTFLLKQALNASPCCLSALAASRFTIAAAAAGNNADESGETEQDLNYGL